MFLSNDIGAVAPHDDFWYQPTGMATASGAKVSHESAMKLTTVMGCVKVLAETLAQVPLEVYRRLPNGGKEKAKNHPIYNVLHNQPNAWQTSFQWRLLMQSHVALRGNAYSEIISGPRGVVDQLIPRHPDRVKIEKLVNGSFRYQVKNDDGTTRPLDRGRVLHIRGLSDDGITGLSPIEVEREAVGVALAAQEYGARFFKNDASPPGWIEHPGHFKDSEARKRFIESYQRSQTGSNRHKTAVFEYGMKYHDIGVKNTDAQFLELLQYKVEDIARIFRVPLILLQRADKASTYASVEQFLLAFVKFTMAPWYTMWEQTLNLDLITAKDTFFIEFNMEGLLRGDSAARSAYYKSGITDGWLAPNEVRIKENMNPKPGLDSTWRPMNMEQADRRSNALVENAANVVSKREIQSIRSAVKSDPYQPTVTLFYQDFADYICRVMVVAKKAAQEYASRNCEEIINAKDADEVLAILDVWEKTKVTEIKQL